GSRVCVRECQVVPPKACPRGLAPLGPLATLLDAARSGTRRHEKRYVTIGGQLGHMNPGVVALRSAPGAGSVARLSTATHAACRPRACPPPAPAGSPASYPGPPPPTATPAWPGRWPGR